MEYEEIVMKFKKYMHQVEDLACDAYKWLMMANHTDDVELKEKYTRISNILRDLYGEELQHIKEMFEQA